MKKLIPAVFLLLLISSCRGGNDNPSPSDSGFAPDVEKGISDFLALYGKGGKLFKENSYVVFDFDNTTAIFDVQLQMLPWQMDVMAFAQSPEEFNETLSYGLAPGMFSDEISEVVSDYSYLYDEYGPFPAEGLDGRAYESLHADARWLDFAVGLGLLYEKVDATGDTSLQIPWPFGWFRGMTSDQQYSNALRCYSYYKNQPSSKVTWEDGRGRHWSWTSGVSVTETVADLWKRLKESGINVWVVSASELEQVRAAVDAFGLHEYCTGIIAMTPCKDAENRYYLGLDPDQGGYFAYPDGRWERDRQAAGGYVWGVGKTRAIDSVLVPRYGNGPIAGFMDSTGDFNFCTEYSSLKMVICFNRANRPYNEGGGLVAEVAVYQNRVLGYDLTTANAAGDTFYMLQGRDENGLRKLRRSSETIRMGSTEPKLFLNEDNYAALSSFGAEGLSTAEIFNKYADTFTDVKYAGYHNKK